MRQRLVACMLAIAAIAMPVVGQAATPDHGVVTPTSAVTWTGTMTAGGANAGGLCFDPTTNRPSPSPVAATPLAACDVFQLDVKVPKDFWGTHVGALIVDIDTYNPPQTDFDLVVYRRNADGTFGAQVQNSGSGIGQPESVGIPKASGSYYVAVIGFTAAPGASYVGHARIYSIAKPKPAKFVGAPPQVVSAIIDTGINPYNVAFRDRSALAKLHPSQYIKGYPKDALPLNLSLNAPSMAAALSKDAAIWASVQRGVLYYVPGTRIIGLISMGNGGVRCGPADFFPLNAGLLPVDTCHERVALDDHGHGTMTASRVAMASHSLGMESRIVEIEGTGAPSVRWAASQGWIDVQSNSWASLVPHPAGGLSGDDIYDAFSYASTRTATFAASGNGLAGVLGFAPTFTYAESTMPPGVIVVGAHDNGRMALWSGSPPTVVADGYGGWLAVHDSMTDTRPDSVACCTSAASPYAAGGAARVILAARRLLKSTQAGVDAQGSLARAGRGVKLPRTGPLSDGVFTLDELKHLLLHSAEARPKEGRDDGLLQWTGDPRAPDNTDRGPAGNPYCNGCQTTPAKWEAIPESGPAYPLIGYGAINERSTDLAIQVLMGRSDEPARADVDQFYAADQQIRTMTGMLSKSPA